MAGAELSSSSVSVHPILVGSRVSYPDSYRAQLFGFIVVARPCQQRTKAKKEVRVRGSGLRSVTQSAHNKDTHLIRYLASTVS